MIRPFELMPISEMRALSALGVADPVVCIWGLRCYHHPEVSDARNRALSPGMSANAGKQQQQQHRRKKRPHNRLDSPLGSPARATPPREQIIYSMERPTSESFTAVPLVHETLAGRASGSGRPLLEWRQLNVGRVASRSRGLLQVHEGREASSGKLRQSIINGARAFRMPLSRQNWSFQINKLGAAGQAMLKTRSLIFTGLRFREELPSSIPGVI